MTTDWFYAHDGARKGPASEDDLRLALIRGEVDRQSLVWCEGMPQWQALESVEALQPLLEQLPPPLPPVPQQPPALPDQASPIPDQASPIPDQASTVPPQAPAPAAAGSAPGDSAAESGDRAEDGDDRPEADRRPPGRAKTLLAEWLNKRADWLANKIGDHLWDKVFSQPVTVYVFITTFVVGGAYTANLLRPKAPPVLETTAVQGTGQVRIDANPWGEVRWVRGPGGKNVDLPEVRTTPLVLNLPAGAYQAQVDYPHTKTSDRCELEVQPDRLATCWLDLAPVDAKSYFQKIGW